MLRFLVFALPGIWVALGWSSADAGILDTIREDVRSTEPRASDPAPSRSEDHHHHHDHCYDDDDPFEDSLSADMWLLAFYMTGLAVTSPFWGPHGCLEDDFANEAFFPRFPYDGVPGYMTYGQPSMHQLMAEVERPPGADGCDDPPPVFEPRCVGRRWSARLRVEYADEFNDVDKIGGHLLLSTASRFGLDAEMNRFRERRFDGGRDRLWLGDCNLVFRFAQSERMQWRAGLGFNWLDDSQATNFGFNFTYGVDWFPARPWVVSSTLDWGNVGRAELFRFRTTAGVVIHGVEAYAGYEYHDIDRTQFNGLIAGVRLWF